MAWIESHQELRQHPKVIKAARALGISKVAMIGHLFCLWWWALDYAQDGDLSVYDPEDIALAAEWEGDANAFIEALTEAARIGERPGLLEYKEGALFIHDWWDYAGKLIDKRQADAARKRAARSTDRPETVMERPLDVRRTSAGCPAPVEGTVQYSTVPNQTEPISPPKPRQLTAEPSTQQAMFGALETTCVLDGKVKSIASRIGKTAKELVAAGITPEQVLNFGAWWKADAWRAEHTPVPKLPHVAEQIKQSLTQRGNGTGPAPPGPPAKITLPSFIGAASEHT